MEVWQVKVEVVPLVVEWPQGGLVKLGSPNAEQRFLPQM
jgi:hypothetical protein